MDTDLLFEENKKLVYFAIRKICANYPSSKLNWIEKEDMEQIGFIGLWKACTRFDSSLNIKFSTYAIPTIIGEMLKEIRDRSGLIKIPRHAKLITKILLKRRNNGEETPTVLQIKKEFNCSHNTAEIALNLMDIGFVSLDAPCPQGDGSTIFLSEILPDDNSNFIESIIKNEELKERLSILDEREKKIIYMSMDEKTQKEIAKVVGLSQVQVSRILKKALIKIQKAYGVDAYENKSQLA